MSDRALIVFVKEPRAGRVKTRLAEAIGPEAAAVVYRALAETVLEATAPEPGEYERLVFFDPPEAAEAMREWLPAGRLRPQCEGDLGRRMEDAFARAFRRGSRRVALVGSDAPGLTRVLVREALFALDHHDVVLGPAHDGGYYLVALRAPAPGLFDAVTWSTPRVLEQTLARAAALGLSVGKLGALRDVDTLADLRAEWARFERALRRAGAEALLSSLEAIPE
jgi:rSAM/selenodomain-associated transferase 1